MATNVDPKGMETRFSVDLPREVQSSNEESFVRRGSLSSLVKVDENGRWIFRVTRGYDWVVCCCGCNGLVIGLATPGFFRTPEVRAVRLVTVAARISFAVGGLDRWINTLMTDDGDQLIFFVLFPFPFLSDLFLTC